MKEAVTKSGDSSDRFIDLIKRGIEAWTSAAELARAEIEKDAEWPERVAAKCPMMLTVAAVRRFANIGVKYIPQLAISEAPGAKRLKTMPLTLQEKYVRGPVGLLVKTDSGWETLQVDIFNLTADQSDQVFADDHARSDAEQRAWIEDRKAKQVAPVTRTNQPWRIVKGNLIVMVPCQFTPKELARIQADMQA
jgi:hypothetical protein